MTDAGKSLYSDAKYMIQYAKDSLKRAEDAQRKEANIIRIGTSPMTPSTMLVEIQKKIKHICPDLKFRLVPFENNPQNAREILSNLGENIDAVFGIFDDEFLKSRGCAGIKVSDEPVCYGMSLNHTLADKEFLEVDDLYSQTLMLIKREYFYTMDNLRNHLEQNHPNIMINDFNFYDTEAFNKCERSDHIITVIKAWDSVHPLMKIIPVNWEFTAPYGILYSPQPSPQVQKFINAVQQVYNT